MTPNCSERAAIAVEWDRFIALAQGEAQTERGKSRVAMLAEMRHWAPDLAAARHRQAETEEASLLLERDGLWGVLAGLQDPDACLERLARGSVLEVAELALLRRWLYASDSWSRTPQNELSLETQNFIKDLNRLPDASRPLKTLERVLTPEGELSEKASIKLASLHSEIRGLKREIGITLDRLLKTLSQKGVLQENFTDVRDGRFVLPIKISSQNDVDGIIYEASASRQTVFVEPSEIAPLNNRLRQRQNELLQEIYAVLEDASKRLHEFASEIRVSVEILSHWDATQARARLGRRYLGQAINVSDERRFELRGTAHPLLGWSLDRSQIIKNDVHFGDPVRTLLLTGPNTGGKTVLLKTLGLAALCARTGFPFPAVDPPIVPYFDEFFADLGDPQSIEHHLSTFSGHIARFKEVLESVSGRSLVLIDELNSSTDPEEGAALGRAFLETTMARGALIVTTTHDPHLKAAAVSDPRILNASMQFDDASRSPTYRMVLGVPGRSRALETAERLGMPEEVLRLARSYLSREHSEFEQMLARLENDVREAESARKQAVAFREEAERIQKDWTERARTSINDLLDRTRQKLRRVLESAQEDVRKSVRKLDELKTRKDLDAARSELGETFNAAVQLIDQALAEEAPDVARVLTRAGPEVKTSVAQFETGMPVSIPKFKNTGTILEIQGDKVKVAMGNLQVTLLASEITPLPPQKNAKRVRAFAGDTSAPPSEIDLRGERLDEAMSHLASYLDQAFRSGSLAQVTIVHGLGTGAIREGARNLLKRLPYVKSFRDGGTGMGGAGATLVEFDR